MTEEPAQQPATAPKPKAIKSKSVKQPPKKMTYAEMVKIAIKELKDRKGSSRQAILKYIKANNTVPSPEAHIKLALKRLVTKKELVQVKGSGASGSFKLNNSDGKVINKDAKKVTKKTGTPKKAAAKPAAKPAAKKSGKAKTTSKKVADPKKTPKKSKSTTKVTPKKAAPKTKKPAAKKAATPKKPPAKKPPAKKLPAKKVVKKVASKTKKTAAKK